jgi:hypothetical protein
VPRGAPAPGGRKYFSLFAFDACSSEFALELRGIVFASSEFALRGLFRLQRFGVERYSPLESCDLASSFRDSVDFALVLI